MKQEAEAALQTALASPNFRYSFLIAAGLELRPALADHAKLQPVKEHIYRTASPQTKFLYDLVRDGNGKCWAIDWTLWQAIKSRAKPSIGKSRTHGLLGRHLLRAHSAQHKPNGTQQTGDQGKLSGHSKSRRSPTAENDLVEITEAEFRMQAGREGLNEARASRTTPAEVGRKVQRDSITSEGTQGVPSPVSVQHLLNAQDDDPS